MFVDGSFGNIEFTGEFTQGNVLIIIEQQAFRHTQNLLFTKKEVLLSYSGHFLSPYFSKRNPSRVFNFNRHGYKTKVRSEERRVGKECRYRSAEYHQKKTRDVAEQG